MHQTLEKFGYPATLLKDFEYWAVLLRPAQVTLGSLVLVAKSDAKSLATLPTEAFVEFRRCCKTIETALQSFCTYDKINYLALMMIDPHVHFHVLPRYAQPQTFDNINFVDSAWPGPPDLKAVTELPENTRSKLQDALRHAFANAAQTAIACEGWDDICADNY